MRRVRTTGARFALQRGVPVDDTPFAYLCPEVEIADGTWSGVLLALVEPTEPVPGSGDTAERIIHSIIGACAGVSVDDAEQRLLHAVHAAHAKLYEDNTNRPISQRIHLGLTVVVLHGEHTFIAQTPPGTLFVRQASDLYEFPSAIDRDGQYQISRVQPLGSRAILDPHIYYTRSNPGDTIVALSTDLARRVSLADDRHANAASVVDTLERVLDACERQYIASGHGVIAVVPERSRYVNPTDPYVAAQHTSSSPKWRHIQRSKPGDSALLSDPGDRFPDTEPLDPVTLTVQTDRAHERSTVRAERDWQHQHHDVLRSRHAPVEQPARSNSHPRHVSQIARTLDSPVGGRPRDDDSVAARTGADDDIIGFSADIDVFDTLKSHTRSTAPGSNDDDGSTREAGADGPRWRGQYIVELLAGLILSLTAAVVGAWQVTKRDRPIHGPLDDGSFGLPRLQRWDESYRPPRMQRLRSRLPRLEVSRIVVLAGLVLLVAVASGYYFTRSNSQELRQSVETMTLLEQAESQRVAALSMPEAARSYDALLALDAALAEANPVDPADAERLSSLRSQISTDIAQITRTYRLSNVQVVGGVPSAPRGISPRLVSGGGSLFLLSDGVYKVDTFSSTLIQMLMPGDVVDGVEVGALRGVAWREDRLLAVDAARTYAFDLTRGVWVAESLSTLDTQGYTDIVAVDTFDRNLYIVTPKSGQILKFQAGAYDGPAEDWTAGVAATELQRAVDMAIDGHVLILLDDGRVLDFFRSRLEATITPQVTPPLDTAAAIAAPIGSQFIYVLHAADGRIIRMTRNGEVVQQFVAPLSGAAPILSGATDLTIDETAGIAHILARDTIFTVRLPSPPE